MSKTTKVQTSKFHRRTQATMSKRPMKVIPVGAWVELGPTESTGQHEAIISAHYEEERIREQQRQKQARLEQFQRDVKQRVRKLQKEKRKQQVQESIQAVELERNVIQQSSHAAEKVTPKKNHCLYRNTEDLSIRPRDGLLSSDAESEQEEIRVAQLRDQSHEIFRMVRTAKRNLAAKQLMPAKSVVPGGCWGEGFTRDIHHSYEPTEISSESDVRIPQQPVDEITSYGDSQEDLQHVALQTTEAVLQTGGISPPKTVTFNPNLGHEPRASPRAQNQIRQPGVVPAYQNTRLEPVRHDLDKSHRSTNLCYTQSQLPLNVITQNTSHKPRKMHSSSSSIPQGQQSFAHLSSNTNNRRKTVTFDPVDDVVCARLQGDGDAIRYPGVCHRSVGRSVPDVKPGVHMEEHKKKIQNQYSMYRRLFMDIEREQVRENQRKKEHQKKINRLKRQKEQERREVENRVSQAMEVRHPLTGETEMEAQDREREEERYVEEMVQKQKQQQQKHKETQRYIRALRAMMKEKMDQQNITLPPLCACGPTVWDSNPETCANNCIFYRNPKAYAKALSSLLISCQPE